MDNSTWSIVAYDPWFDLAPWDEGCDGDHCHYDSYRRFNQLRQKNPKLKTLLSIGGWNSGSEQWSEMAADPAKRKIFVDSSVAFATTFDFDGLDFDWEYPGGREGSDPEHDKLDFTLLVQELGAALRAKGKLFTAAIAADFKRAEVGYDVPAMSKEFDFFNIMDYDYHGGWDNFTGHNTPLFGRHEEDDENHPGHRFNLNDTVTYYIEAGMPKEKMIVGMATFGHGFVLPENTDETGLYCPAIAGNPPGPYTRQEGFLEYYEILQAFNNDTLPWLPGATPKAGTSSSKPVQRELSSIRSYKSVIGQATGLMTCVMGPHMLQLLNQQINQPSLLKSLTEERKLSATTVPGLSTEQEMESLISMTLTLISAHISTMGLQTWTTQPGA